MTVFRAYDIRGVAEVDFDVARVERLGRACGLYFRNLGVESAVVGKDCRATSTAYHNALVRGLVSCGIDVISLGMVPTPVLYFGIKHLGKTAGVMVTASHNPPQYNGFKVWAGHGTIHGEEIEKIRRLYEDAVTASPPAIPPGLVSAVDILPDYEEAVLSRVRLSRPLKVVVDGGNGVGGELCARLLQRMGVEVVPLFCEPDGSFPNHHPDPVVEENMLALRVAVIENNAQLGIGLDGDADRIGLMDELGRLLCGDELLSLYARDLLARLPGSAVVADVKCSDRLFDDIRAHGGEPVMHSTGHSLIKATMHERGIPLGGEMSGHMFFTEGWYGFDDAIYGAARFAQIFSEQKKPLSQLLNWPPAFATREINVPCADDRKFEVVDAVRRHFLALYPVETMDGARISFAHGWGLVRASNTQPVLVTRYEADSGPHLADIKREVEDALRKIL